MTTLQHLHALLRSGTARPWKTNGVRVTHTQPWGTVLHVADVTFEPDASLAVAAVNHLDALLRVAECAEAYIEAREAALDAAGHCTCSGASHDTTNAAGCLRAEAEWSRDQELDNLRRALSILTRLEAK